MLRLALILFIESLIAVPALAGSLSITPVRVELSNTQRSIALTVRNDGDQPSVVQAQLVAWSQESNEDKLDPTVDLLASPPIFTVAPGASQILRVALRRAPDSAVERTYRILVNEVPGKPQPGFTGAQFALKISLPIFVDAMTAKTAPKIEWSAKLAPTGDIALTMANTGSRHLQVHSAEVLNDQSTVDAAISSMFYVLPGQRRTMSMKPIEGRTPAAGRYKVRAESDAGPLSADVVVDPR